MFKSPTRRAVETSIISAFTIATAFIWKDVILGFIHRIVPTGQEFYYELLTAVIATGILVIAIYTFLKTEKEADLVLNRLINKSKLKKESLKRK